MGQEISVTTLQLALAYAAVANGGYLMQPSIVKNINLSNNYNFTYRPIRQIMRTETSKSLLNMMEEVVNIGTAKKASIPGFRIGGKTGTAEKFVDGKYSDKEFISSFAAIFPLDEPQYICVISIDSPQYGFHWGNETAAPIVKDIFERIIIKDGIEPNNNLILNNTFSYNKNNRDHFIKKELYKILDSKSTIIN